MRMRPVHFPTIRIAQLAMMIYQSPHFISLLEEEVDVASWINRPLLGVYGATKSAAWALTNCLRHELHAQGTQVLGMHVGFVDTDLTRSIDAPKSPPEAIVRRTLDALEAGAQEVLADEITRQVKQGLSAEPGVYLMAPAG